MTTNFSDENAVNESTDNQCMAVDQLGITDVEGRRQLEG
jgi:hypothetical protein